MDTDTPKSPRALRFSLFALMFLMTCVCGYLGGYRAGYKAGDSSWQYGTMVARTYDVADLLTPIPEFRSTEPARADFTQLLQIVEDAKLGQPEECEIRPFETNLCLVVSANGVVHRRVHHILEELRRGRQTVTRVD